MTDKEKKETIESEETLKNKSRRNILRKTFAVFLILISLALIFNSKIRDMMIVWNTNK